VPIPLVGQGRIGVSVAQHDFAGGQARAVIFFLVLAVVSIIQVSIGKRREIEL
jgi:raffinose/stachyose/melibiose transport system permease protein